MEFGYSSSASSSPDPQAFALPLIYDNTTDSSTPPSPDDLQPMMFYNTVSNYDMGPYPTDPVALSTMNNSKISVEFQQSNSQDSHDRRRKRTGNTAKDKTNSSSMHLRRRAQNRASQRAFRERKEKHLKGLEAQLSELHERHQDLLQSYTRQADEVTKLHARIADLTSELDTVRSTSEASLSDIVLPDKFDAVPASTMLYSGPNFYFDKGVLDMAPNISQESDLL